MSNLSWTMSRCSHGLSAAATQRMRARKIVDRSAASPLLRGVPKDAWGDDT